MIYLWAILYLTVVGITMNFLLIESRFPRRQTLLLFGTATVLLCGALVLTYFHLGLDTLVRTYSLIVHLPVLLLFLWISRYRGWRLVFQALSTILFCGLIHQGGGLAYYFSGQKPWALILAYLPLSALFFWFLLRYLRPLYRQVLFQLHRGWWLMCLVMAAHYAIYIYLIPGYVGDTLFSTILKPAISCLMVGFYTILMAVFVLVRREADAQYSTQLYALRLSALQDRMDAVRAAEEATRVERHDLRHRLQAAARLVERGERQAALDFLDAAQRRLDEQAPVHWCRPPVLDAVLSSYFDQAQRQSIRVDARISLPERLPVDEGELAIVFANALENAIHACMALPPEQRELHFQAIGHPGLMFELTNPCRGPVRFSDQGLPLPDREGHGFGTQSIASFCEKYGALCAYEPKEGWFPLGVIL